MAAAILIAAATACSSGDSTKVFTAGGESGATAPASSPGPSGGPDTGAGTGADAAGVVATQTATPAAVPTDETVPDQAVPDKTVPDKAVGDEAVGDTGGEATEKITGGSAPPSPSPSPSRRTTPAPETEPPMRLAAPARPAPRADRPVVVDVVEPEDRPRDAPGGTVEVVPDGEPRVVPVRPSPRTPSPRPSRTTADGPEAGWSGPVLVEDFEGDGVDESRWAAAGAPSEDRPYEAVSVGGGVLRLAGGRYDGVDLSGGVAGTFAQRYGRWEVRVRAEDGAVPVALLRPAPDGADGAEIGVADAGGQGRRMEAFVGDGAERARSEVRTDLTRWHTITVDWLPGRVTFWLDGRRVWSYTGPLVPRTERMGLVLRNDAVCDAQAPCGDAATPGKSMMYVDWVRIYRAPGR